jgi:hypothetical protein
VFWWASDNLVTDEHTDFDHCMRLYNFQPLAWTKLAPGKLSTLSCLYPAVRHLLQAPGYVLVTTGVKATITKEATNSQREWPGLCHGLSFADNKYILLLQQHLPAWSDEAQPGPANLHITLLLCSLLALCLALKQQGQLLSCLHLFDSPLLPLAST